GTLHFGFPCRPLANAFNQFGIPRGGSEIPAGKQAAFTPPVNPPAPRAPLGPSVIFKEGIPSRSTGTVYQSLVPASMATFSCKVIWLSRFSTSCIVYLLLFNTLALFGTLYGCRLYAPLYHKVRPIAQKERAFVTMELSALLFAMKANLVVIRAARR